MNERLAIAGLITVFAACSEPPEEAPAADVLARVDGVEITTRQLDDALEILYPGADRPQNAPRQTLQRLIDFELLVKEAKARGLDADMKVTTAVDQSQAGSASRRALQPGHSEARYQGVRGRSPRVFRPQSVWRGAPAQPYSRLKCRGCATHPAPPRRR